MASGRSGGRDLTLRIPDLRPRLRSADLLIKFVPSETLEHSGGAGRYASANVNSPDPSRRGDSGASIDRRAATRYRAGLRGCGQARWRAASTAGATEPLLATNP